MMPAGVNRSVLCFVNGLQREQAFTLFGSMCWGSGGSPAPLRSVQQQTAVCLTLVSGPTGGVSGRRGVAAFQEGRGLALVQEHLHRLVRHRPYLGSDQRGHHGPLRTRYPLSLLTDEQRQPHVPLCGCYPVSLLTDAQSPHATQRVECVC